MKDRTLTILEVVDTMSKNSSNANSNNLSPPKPSRFVTLQHAFHPEDADVCITTRKQQIAENKWGAVWVEATLVSTDAQPQQEVVAVSSDVEEAPNTTTSTTSTDSNLATSDNDATPNVDVVEDKLSTTTTPIKRASALVMDTPLKGGHFFDTMFGLAFTIAAVVTAVAIELLAAIVYVLAVGFYKTADYCLTRGQRFVFFLPFYGLFQTVYSVLTFLDAVLLTLSVFAAEILAYFGWLLTVCAGGYKKGAQWHQYIRKLCHLTRWAFRGFHHGWEPSRVFPFCKTSVDADEPEPEPEPETSDESVNTVVAQVVVT